MKNEQPNRFRIAHLGDSVHERSFEMKFIISHQSTTLTYRSWDELSEQYIWTPWKNEAMEYDLETALELVKHYGPLLAPGEAFHIFRIS